MYWPRRSAQPFTSRHSAQAWVRKCQTKCTALRQPVLQSLLWEQSLCEMSTQDSSVTKPNVHTIHKTITQECTMHLEARLWFALLIQMHSAHTCVHVYMVRLDNQVARWYSYTCTVCTWHQLRSQAVNRKVYCVPRIMPRNAWHERVHDQSMPILCTCVQSHREYATHAPKRTTNTSVCFVQENGTSAMYKVTYSVRWAPSCPY